MRLPHVLGQQYEDTDSNKVKELMNFSDSFSERYKLMALEKGTMVTRTSDTTTTTNIIPITTAPQVSHAIQPTTLFPPPPGTSRTPPVFAMPTESESRPYTTPSHYAPAPTFIKPEFSKYKTF